MKRILSLCVLATALVVAATALAQARHHSVAAHPVARVASTKSDAAHCPPGCTKCPLQGTAAAAERAPSGTATPAMNAASCPVADPANCPASCPRTASTTTAAVATR